MVQAFLATFGAVFVAEIAGDKLLYTTGALATQYRARSIVCGMAAAFMAKMGAAVMFGRIVSQLPRDHSQPRAVMVSFASVFFSEWGDIGQITAASMAARYASPLVVWLGAVAAMVSKGVLTTSFGASVRGWMQGPTSPRMLRYGGVTVLVALGLISALQTLARMR